MSHIQKIIKEFDEKFARINEMNRGVFVISDISGSKFEVITDKDGKVTDVGNLNVIKSFLLSSHLTYLEEEVKRLEGEMEEIPLFREDKETIIRDEYLTKIAFIAYTTKQIELKNKEIEEINKILCPSKK
jgi:hypothetical protein